MSPVDPQGLISRLGRWAETQDDLRAAAVIGSQARTERPADPWSDVDVVLVTETPDRYLSDATWASPLGDVCLSYLEPTPVGGYQERRILFTDGLECDVAVLPAAVQRASGTDLATVLAVTRRGVLPLLDRDGWIASLEDGAGTVRVEPDPPTEAAFAQLVADTLHHVLLAARKLARGERFVACLTLDGLLAARYVELAAWHARVVGGVSETWPAGRFLEAWADPRVLAALPEVTARCADDDLRRALVAFLDAFEVIAVETAAALGHPYPHAAQRRVAALTAVALAG